MPRPCYKRHVIPSARMGPYTADQCAICWKALNDPNYKQLYAVTKPTSKSGKKLTVKSIRIEPTKIKLPPVKLLVVENKLLLQMAGEATFVAAFPELQELAATLNLPLCCSEATQKRQPLFNAFKRAVGDMPAERKLQFKAMLNAENVQLHYSTQTKNIRVDF